MGKFVLVVLGIYILYYAGNIIYDLYIKKEKVEEPEEQVLTIDGIETEENVSNIQIDDVEEINSAQNTQEEYESDYNGDDDKSQHTQQINIETIKQKHEAENELENYTTDENKDESDTESIEIQEEPIVKKGFGKLFSPFDIKQMIQNAETKVTIADVKDGYAFYNLG